MCLKPEKIIEERVMSISVCDKFRQQTAILRETLKKNRLIESEMQYQPLTN
jgi:hypothetical protein